SYVITAKAYDNRNAEKISTAVNVVVTGSASVNLALNKPAFASTSTSALRTPKYAVDGVANTRWESASADPQWMYVDLGATYTINRVKIIWEAAKGKNYVIEISNDINNWGTPVKTVTNNTALTNDFTDISGTGRYVRMYGTARATGYGYSVFEFEVYGTA